MERVTADVAHRGLHRIRLAGTITLAWRRRCAAASTETAPAAAEVSPPGRRAWVLHKSLVEGLLEWIWDARRVEIIVEVIVTRWAVLARAFGTQRRL